MFKKLSHKWKKWVLPTKITIIIALIGLPASLEYYYNCIKPSEPIKEEINIFNELDSAPNNLDYSTLKGMSVFLILRINSMFSERDKYIFDWGIDSIRNRASLLFDKYNNLLFKVYDNNSKLFSLKLEKEKIDSIFHRPIAMLIGIYSGVNFWTQNIYINNHEIGKNLISDSIDFDFNILRNDNFNIINQSKYLNFGRDLNKNNCSSFGAYLFATSLYAPSADYRRKLFNISKEYILGVDKNSSKSKNRKTILFEVTENGKMVFR